MRRIDSTEELKEHEIILKEIVMDQGHHDLILSALGLHILAHSDH